MTKGSTTFEDPVPEPESDPEVPTGPAPCIILPGDGSRGGPQAGKSSGRLGHAGAEGGADGRPVTAWSSIKALTQNADPVSRWQLMQWQQCTMSGARSRR